MADCFLAHRVWAQLFVKFLYLSNIQLIKTLNFSFHLCVTRLLVCLFFAIDLQRISVYVKDSKEPFRYSISLLAFGIVIKFSKLLIKKCKINHYPEEFLLCKWILILPNISIKNNGFLKVFAHAKITCACAIIFFRNEKSTDIFCLLWYQYFYFMINIKLPVQLSPFKLVIFFISFLYLKFLHALLYCYMKHCNYLIANFKDSVMF